jgi:prefoldin subunit 5
LQSRIADPLGFTPSSYVPTTDSYGLEALVLIQRTAAEVAAGGGGLSGPDGENIQRRIRELEDAKEEVQASLNAVDASLNAVDASLNAVDASLNAVDASLNAVDASLNAVDASLNAVDASLNAVDASLNAVDASLNAVDASLEDLVNLYSAAPMYTAGVSTSGSTSFTVTWTLPVRKALNFIDPGAQAVNLVPRINSTRVMIRRTDTVPVSAFVQVELSTSPTTFLSRTFGINTTFGTGAGAVTIVAGGTYDVKVYGVNFAGDDETKQLIITDLSLQAAGSPSIVQTPTSFTAPSRTSLRFAFFKPEFNDTTNDNTDTPAISLYRVRYQAVGSVSRAVPYHDESEVTFDTNATNLTTQVDRSSGIVQATRYRWLGISARNAVNPNFGPELAPNTEVTTANPISADFTTTRSPTGATITSQSRTFWRGVPGASITQNYYNTAGGGTGFASAFAFSGTSTFFVNGGRLGTITTDALVTLESRYKGTLENYTTDQTVSLPGFKNDGTLNTITTSPATPTVVGFTTSTSISDPQAESTNLKTMAIVGQTAFTSAVSPGNGDYFPVSGTNIYSIQFSITGQGSFTDVQSSTSSSYTATHDFVVDDLSGNPSVSSISSTTSNFVYARVCNIPSVSTFELSVEFTASNLCSATTLFVPNNRRYARLELSSTSLNGPTLNEDFNFTTAANNPETSRAVSSAARTVRIPKTQPKIDITANAPDQLSELGNVITCRAYNLRGEASAVAVISDSEPLPIWFDGASFTNDPVSTIQTFGTNAFVWDPSPSNRYTLPTQVNHTTDITDSQLLFVNNRYSARSGYYRDYSGYKGVGPDYSGFSTSGSSYSDNSYKWIIFRFSGRSSFVTSTINTQVKQVMINGASRASWSADVVVFTMQIQTNGELPGIQTMWLNARKSFVDTELASYRNRALSQALTDDAAFGNHDDNNAGYYVFVSSGSDDRFDIYVRVGIRVGSGALAEVTSVGLNDLDPS